MRYLANPPGISRQRLRRLLDGLAELNQQHLPDAGDPEIEARFTRFQSALARWRDRMQAMGLDPDSLEAGDSEPPSTD